MGGHDASWVTGAAGRRTSVALIVTCLKPACESLYDCFGLTGVRC